MTFTVLTIRGSSAARRPKRTSARASGLTMASAGRMLSPGGRFLIVTDPLSAAGSTAFSGATIRT